MKTIYSFIILMLMGTLAFAQTPEAFKYQAVIGNGDGAIIANTTVALRISVLQGSDVGTAVYEETFHPVTNAHGLVDIEVGNGSFYSIDWGTHAHFLKIEVDPSNGTDFTHLGTSPLLSVPYALIARSVEEDMIEDADADPNNELQSISLVGSDLTLSEGGGTVTLPSTGGGDNWGAQVVESDATLAGAGTSGDPLSVVGDLTDDQVLSIVGNDLTIEDGNTVTLPSSGGGDNWGAQVVESDATLSGAGTSGDPLGVVGDLTDDQTLSIVGNDLSILDGNTVAVPSSPWLPNVDDIYYSAGNVGINTTSPMTDFHVYGDGRFEWYSGTLSITTPGSWPGLICNIQTGERRDITFRDFGISILASTTNASPGLLDGLWVLPGGNVGIHSWAPGSFPLLINERDVYGLAIRRESSGDVWEIFAAASGDLGLYHGSTTMGWFDGTSGVYTPSSDRRSKTDIKPLKSTLSDVKKIIPSTYEMKAYSNGEREIGLVAQELKKHFPELVYEFDDEKTGKKFYTVNYNGIAVVAVKSIQEQQEVIEDQSARIDELERKLERLEARMNRF